MWVESLRIEGFRSIAEIRLPLASRITILVGRNSTGKSNILRALSLATNAGKEASQLLSQDFSPEAYRIFLRLEVTISPEERKSLVQPINKAKVQVSKPLTDFSRGNFLRLRYNVSVTKSGLTTGYYLGYRKTSKFYPLFGKGTSPPDIEVLHAFETILEGQYLAIQCQDCFDRIPASEQNDIAHLLMQQYLHTDPSIRSRYNEVRDALWFVTEGIGGEIQPAQLPVEKSTESEAKYQLRSEIEKRYHVPLPYMGDGAKRAALVLYHIVNSPQRIISIEEPETNLHPGAQKRLRSKLDSLCAKYGKRLVLTTHSTIFIDRWESASVHKVDIVNGLTSLSPALARERLTDVAQLLGVSPGDALAADGIIWVEGPSDLAVYAAFFKALRTDLEANNISLMWVGGDTLRHITVGELKQLNPNFTVLVDSERTSARAGIPKWKHQFSKDCQQAGYAFFMTGRRSIENYFTLTAIRQYYNAPKMPPLGEYDNLAVHIQNNVQGKVYSKMRDAARIAKLMSAADVENLGDVTAALHQVQSLISKWKHLQ